MPAQILESHAHPKYPRLRIQLRRKSRFYQGLTFLDGKKVQRSLKTRQLETALKLGESWYKRLLRSSVTEGHRHPMDRLATEQTVGELFAGYRLTLPKHRREYVDIKWSAIGPYWRAVLVTDVTPQRIREFFAYRRKHKTHLRTVVTNNTLHKDLTLLQQILTYAIEQGHLTALPIIPRPGTISKNPRPWLTESEWSHLVAVGHARIEEAKRNPRLHQQRIDTLDFARFMVASMCRVGELLNLRFRDCEFRVNEGPAEQDAKLLFTVTGKHGTRTLVADADAVEIVQSRVGEADDLIFAEHHRDAFRELLKAAHLHQDQFGFTRNYKSLRATSISRAVLQPGSNLLQIARNAGTSVAMIDDFYAKRLTAELQTRVSHPVALPVR